LSRHQFVTEEEYTTYPRDITKDVDLLRSENVDYVFTPPEEEMYPPDFSTFVQVENFGKKVLGIQQSAYIRGTTTTTLKMLHIIKPAFIFLGQKDGLQGSILKKMIRDLNIPTEIVVSPVVRDASGLAYAARNYFLSPEHRQAAPVIFRSLKAAENAVMAGETQAKKIIKELTKEIEKEPLAKLEFAIIADPDNLEPLHKIDRRALIAVGATIGSTSLIDSLLVEAPEH
jgi:pantoate--beta-alanine ligase